MDWNLKFSFEQEFGGNYAISIKALQDIKLIKHHNSSLIKHK